jgi:carboxyl-terminal processing protease
MKRYVRPLSPRVPAPRRVLWYAAALALAGLCCWGLLTVPGLTQVGAAPFPWRLEASPSGAETGALQATDAQLKVFMQAMDLIEQNYVDKKTSKDLVYGAIQGAVGSLDPHSSFMTPEEFKELQIETKGKFSGIGIEISLKNRILTVVSPIEGTPAYRAGLRAGDQILKIDGVSTKNITLTEAVKKIRGLKGTKVTLTINRQGFSQPKDFTLVREIIPIRSVKARLIEGGYGYIRVTNFQDQTDRDLKDYLEKIRQRQAPLKGLVLDLRNDPGGLLEQAVQVADEFLASGLIVKTQGRDLRHRMVFNARPGQPGEQGFPIVVLINEGSASASEIVAGALKDHKRALIVGTKSFGKGSVQTIIPLEDGSALRLTTALYYTPSGQTINDVGIIPDIEVKEPEPAPGKSLEHLRDEALDRHMRGEGITDKPWDHPLTEQDLKQDPVLQKAVELLRRWPPAEMSRPARS